MTKAQLIHLYSLRVTFQTCLENQIAVKELNVFPMVVPSGQMHVKFLVALRVDGSILFPVYFYKYGHSSDRTDRTTELSSGFCTSKQQRLLSC